MEEFAGQVHPELRQKRQQIGQKEHVSLSAMECAILSAERDEEGR